MHDVLGADYLAAECRTDTLVAETDAKHRNFSGKLLQQRHANSGFMRGTWAG